MYSVDELLYNIVYENYSKRNEIIKRKMDLREEILYKKLGIPTYKEYEQYVIKCKDIINSEYSYARRSARRAYNKVMDITRCNMQYFKYFITLTFADKENEKKYDKLCKNEGLENFFEYVNGYDFDESLNAYRNFYDRIYKRMKKEGKEFKYVTVWEKQKSGKYHYHLICNDYPKDEEYIIPKWLAMDYKKYEYDTGIGLKLWTYGKSEVQRVRDERKMTTYISKYIVKSFKNIDIEEYREYKERKKYYCSRNLIRPKEVYCNDEEIEKYFDMTVEADISTSYEDFLGYQIRRSLRNIKESEE